MAQNDRTTTAAYIASLLTDLRKTAEAAKLEELAYLLSLAEAEAKSIKSGENSENSAHD